MDFFKTCNDVRQPWKGCLNARWVKKGFYNLGKRNKGKIKDIYIKDIVKREKGESLIFIIFKEKQNLLLHYIVDLHIYIYIYIYMLMGPTIQ